MSEYNDLMVESDAELAAVNNEIDDCEAKLAGLKLKRRDLLLKMQDIDMGIVLECIEEYGLSAKDMLQLITAAADDKGGAT